MKYYVFLLLAALVFSLTGCTPQETNDEPPTEQVTEVGIELIADGFTSPLGFISSGDGTGRMFIVDQIGVIHVMENGTVLDEHFLDIRDSIVGLRESFDERGLLSLAFHPNFAENGRFFVHFSAPLREGGPEGWDHTGTVTEFRVDETNSNRANPDSKRIILEIDQPQFNHNGGHIAFGPDNFLYIPLGDGGGANDVGRGHPDIGNGQDPSTLLGSILRIDIDGGDPYAIPADNPFIDDSDAMDEIFAYGFRNPYHISFDNAGEGTLFAIDVGQDLWEEVNIVTMGNNYGWNIREGKHCFDPDNPTEPPDECPETGTRGEDLTDPIFEYRNARHDGIGIAIVGGYVYRGEALNELRGNYIFADWSRGFDPGDGSLFSASETDDGWDINELEITTGSGDGRLGRYILAIGEDADGELYLLTTGMPGPAGNTGEIYRIVPAE
jgi:glucose/arabinose dehydrogenase